MANDPSLIVQSGVNLEDALRKLHVRDNNGNLHAAVSAFITIWRSLPRTRWQFYASLLELLLLFHVVRDTYIKFQIIASSSFLIVKMQPT